MGWIWLNTFWIDQKSYIGNQTLNDIWIIFFDMQLVVLEDLENLGITNAAEAQGEEEGQIWPKLMSYVNYFSISSKYVGAN